jgi:hypothetical protein
MRLGIQRGISAKISAAKSIDRNTFDREFAIIEYS